MKVLHLANTPLSNAPANITSCLNHVGIDAKLFIQHKSNRNKVFVGGDTWIGLSEEVLVSEFERADIIHFHNFTWSQGIFVQWPRLIEIAKKKKLVVQFHSARKAHEYFDDTIRDSEFAGKRIVIAQYHTREYPECEWIVPNPLPLHEDRFRLIRKGKWTDMPPISLSYAPSNQHLRGWDYKGYDVLEPKFKQYQEMGFSTDIITNTPYENCLVRKSYSHVGLEEIFTGSYHLSFLEYMALECVTIGHLDNLTINSIKKVLPEGAFEKMPYLEVSDIEQLTGTLMKLARSVDIKSTAEKSRAWMNEFWGAKQTMEYYKKVYETIS